LNKFRFTKITCLNLRTNNYLKTLNTYSTYQNTMALYLNSSTPYEAFPSEFTRDSEGNVLEDYEFRVPISVEEEDIAMAKNIGVLPLDKYDPSLGEDMEIEFLLMIAKEEGDAHEDMMDELDELWNKDMDRMTCDVGPIMFGFQVPPSHTTQDVRIVLSKHGFCIGSIAGQKANVYIPMNIEGAGKLCRHTPYRMDLMYKPQGKNLWCATKVYPKLDTEGMLVSVLGGGSEDGQGLYNYGPGPMVFNKNTHNSHFFQKYTFHVPAHKDSIGVIIGRDGKNIDALVFRELERRGYEECQAPCIYITPISDYLIKVVVLCGVDSFGYEELYELISNMHS